MDWDSNMPGSIMSAIRQYLDEDRLVYRQVDERMIQAGFQGKHLSYQMLVFSHEQQHRAVFYSVVPLRIPQEQRLVVAEYLCRANHALMIGNFELDVDCGDVRYKTSVDVEGGELTVGMVKTLLHINLSTADKYVRGLIGVLYRELTPAEAIAELEGSSAVSRLAAQASQN